MKEHVYRKEIQRRIEEAFDEILGDVVDHFDTDAWPLDLNILNDEIVGRVLLQEPVFTRLITELASLGYRIDLQKVMVIKGEENGKGNDTSKRSTTKSKSRTANKKRVSSRTDSIRARSKR